MIVYNNTRRSEQAEIMDNFDFKGSEMKDLLRDLKIVNKFLGGNQITFDGLKELLRVHPKEKTIKILDIGCGDGEVLRKCTDFAKKNNFKFECIGIDFNENILYFAKKQSEAYSNITFQKIDVFSEINRIPDCDIALCTLVLHHFKDEQIEELLTTLIDKAKIGIVVNDLQRSKQAFQLFKLFSNVFLKTKTARHDGLVSIARSFKELDLKNISKKIPNQKSIIKWCWAYRYQWILKKNI